VGKIDKAAKAAEREPWVEHDAVAEYLCKKPAWLYENADRLGIPRVRLGNQWRYKISAVEAWLTSGRAA
jgi:hypothetical protein